MFKRIRKIAFSGDAGLKDHKSNGWVDGFADMCYTIPK